MEIHIPFKPRFVPRLEADIKTWTSRTRKYGSVGDYFIVNGSTYEIKSIFEMRLESIAHDHWREEGFDCEEDFIVFWKSIHPRKSFDPEQVVWVHTFQRMV